MRALGVLIVLSAGLAQDLPSIRVDVNLVNVLCTVRDRRGALVNNLKQDDFILLEDGVPQTIRHFARETDLPLTVGMLVDTSNSQVRLVDAERKASAQFFSQVIRPRDAAFLMSFDAGVELLMDRASSPQSIKAGLEKLQQNSPRFGARGRIARAGGTRLYDAVYQAATERLRKESGRKAIVLITDGTDVGSSRRMDDAIDAAQKADAIIYGIYYVDNKAYGGAASANSQGQSVLRELSEETGGRFFRVDKWRPLKAIFDQIQQEMRSQYTLAFTSSNEAKERGYRRLEVQLRIPDLTAQARKGYYAAQ